MLTIFDYLDPSLYLKDMWEDKRKSNPNFSLRSWAKQMGFRSHAPLHYMLQGERKIPKKYIPFFVKSLKLKKQEAKYFEAMVDLQRSKSIEEKEIYLDQLQSISPNPLREATEVDSYKYLQNPMHIILSEMTELKNFKYNLKWIKDHLRFNVSLKEIEDTTERLLKLGLAETVKGKLQKTYKHLTSKPDSFSLGVQEYHKRMALLAIDQLKQPVEEREFNSYTFNIKKEDLPQIKNAIRKFSDELIREFEAPKDQGEETYHLNLHFFSLSKK